jgi:hypothetical protein
LTRKNARNEHGVSSAKPFNAYNYARNVPRSMTASLEILPPAHTHTHTHRLVRNATNVRSFFVSADSVYTSKFTATTYATLKIRARDFDYFSTDFVRSVFVVYAHDSI